MKSSKKQKVMISRSAVEAIHSLDPPGRFLKQCPDTGEWQELPLREACDKAAQAMAYVIRSGKNPQGHGGAATIPSQPADQPLQLVTGNAYTNSGATNVHAIENNGNSDEFLLRANSSLQQQLLLQLQQRQQQQQQLLLQLQQPSSTTATSGASLAQQLLAQAQLQQQQQQQQHQQQQLLLQHLVGQQQRPLGLQIVPTSTLSLSVPSSSTQGALLQNEMHRSLLNRFFTLAPGAPLLGVAAIAPQEAQQLDHVQRAALLQMPTWVTAQQQQSQLPPDLLLQRITALLRQNS